MNRRRPPGAAARPVRVLTVLPADPEQLRLGGIASFVRGFVKFAPPDFELGFLGLSSTRTPGRWHEVELEGRGMQFFPVARMPAGRSRIPLALRFTAALLAHRRAFASRHWIPAFHRPATDLSFPGRDRPMWRVVHLTVDDLTTAGSESRWHTLGGPLAMVEERSFARMARIYVVNRQAADAYRARFPHVADRFDFLPNWADPTVFGPGPGRGDGSVVRSDLRRQLDMPADARVLLFAARLEGQKDPLLMARAFAAARQADRAMRLIVAGEGALRDSMEDELAATGALDAVRFMGTVPRERLAELMRGSDALVITSGFETGPTVGLEALASGLPVATTDVGEVAALVAQHGAGAVARSRATEDVVAAIHSVLGADRFVIGQAAVAAAEPRLADRALDTLYEENRLLAERLQARP